MGSEISLAVLDASLMLSNLGLTPSHSPFHIHTPAIWFWSLLPIFKRQRPRLQEQNHKSNIIWVLKKSVLYIWIGFCYQRNRSNLFETSWGRSHTRLSVMLQQDHRILSHREDRVNALLHDPRLHVWKWIIFYYHSCMIVFLFNGQVLASWKALLISRDLQEIVFSADNAEIPTLLHLTGLGMVFCVFPKCTITAQPYIPRPFPTLYYPN